MKEIKVKDLQVSKNVKSSIYFKDKELLLLPGMSFDKKDFENFKKWKISTVYSSEDSISTIEKDVFLIDFKEKSPIIFNTINHSLNLLNKYYGKLLNKKINNIEDLKKISKSCIDLVKKNSDILNICLITSFSEPSIALDSIKMAIYSTMIGFELKLNDKQMEELLVCSLLVNVGMLNLEVLSKKKEPLTKKEISLIKSHPILGFKIIKNLNLDNIYGLTLLTHHENVNGTGYPKGIKGNQIPLYSKIIAVVENYVALSSVKKYRDKYNLYQSMKTLISTGKQKIDPEILSAFLSNLSLYPIGSVIRTNKGNLGIVLSVNKGAPLQPIILTKDNDQKTIINLNYSKGIFIKENISDKDLIQDTYNLLNE